MNIPMIMFGSTRRPRKFTEPPKQSKDEIEELQFDKSYRRRKRKRAWAQ